MYTERQPEKTGRSRIKQKLLSLAFNTGIIRAGRQLWANFLTVLNYHRINDITRPDFDSFKPNVSATPSEFDRQMNYLARWFNVISVHDLAGWLEGRARLPRYAALITFDDGYLDNYIHAFPILKKYNFSAVIFLSTGHIGTDAPFFWDLAAYCFSYTQRDRVSFADGKVKAWKNSMERDQIQRSWIEALKSRSYRERQAIVARLPELLNVSIPQGYFRSLMMSWDQVRELHTQGMEFGGHTVNHPILTRVPLDTAKAEIEGSKAKIESELGQSITSFAYPNGGTNDFNRDIENITSRAGYKAAFSLLNGPSALREVKRNPFAIRRIFISNNHTFPEFGILVSPFNRYRP